VNNVRDGAFAVATKLFGLTFTKLENMPLYHPECQVYEVKDADGSHIGVIYLDFFPRESKKGGAWMTNYREQKISADGKNIRPVVSLTCNFSKPVGDKPALLSYDEVETFFHEFGHGLHGLFRNVLMLVLPELMFRATLWNYRRRLWSIGQQNPKC
jgi:peptidyl-dipeptidase Dcp